MADHKTPLSEAIRAIRVRLGVSQNGLGRMLYVTSNTVSRWERGKIVPSTWQLARLHELAKTKEEIEPIRMVLESRGIISDNTATAT
jgi:DNA-binding transcriptional regulator YiaG